MANQSYERVHKQFTITGAQSKYSIKANVATANNPFSDGSLRIIAFQCDSSVGFNIHDNSGTPFPLAANATYMEGTDPGSEIQDVYLTTTGTTVVNFYGRR